MAREFAKTFYRSKEWQRCRLAYISHRKSIDGGMCETCHEKPGYIVHRNRAKYLDGKRCDICNGPLAPLGEVEYGIDIASKECGAIPNA